ncbi:PREDICTED: uncharacterized protein LOC109360782 [Lupinus angustifolius]|uniref:uncharacterized protein LOC109332582 n=3 Tax=Lupinus angustifolius TaxID=3871 RepID=UPI00092F6039|nr:PREDICTED: uncharacterized protein LOC109332582 [Lupinus angustifolius]XP_019447248.1 PREDICTED: uncharacterized protein LOC109350469 [Lupinus angustifolius]XP_019461491.1 PREDICTED: uncharacterized protein LOC109360782 [Lupinus angustifolius]
MAIVRDIVSDFSDEEEIEICSDEEEVQFGSSSSRSITYTTPSPFFLNTNSQAGRDIGHVTESRPDRYVAKCKHFGAGCEWRIRACYNVKRDYWEIRKISGTHSCVSMVVSQDHSKLNSSFIADLIVNLVSADPSIPVKALVKWVVSRFGYTVTYRKAWTAKQMAMAKIYGDWEGSYNELPRWMNALQYFCPDTIVKYQAHHEVVDGMEDPSRIILDRIFWAFKPCIEGFGYCKPILQVDGTFLTGKYTGTLLIASSQDGNRRVFPVAFAIVEGETKEAWEWFFFNLKTYVTPQENLCIISDRGTGLLAALRSELTGWSSAQSVYCIRHVASNFNKEFRDSDLKDKVVEMGYELMRPRFERMLNSLRQKNSRAAAWLDQIPKEKWSQAYDGGRRYGHMTTNLAECINGVLKGSRALPITALVRATYYRLNEWFNEHRNEASNMVMAGHVYCEELTKVIKENQRKSTCQLVRNFSRETGVSEVEVVSRSAGRQVRLYTVKLAENWCDCGEFQSLRLPCSHAIATCASLNLDCSQFISTIYRLDNLQKVYGYEFQPLGNEEYWPPYSGPTFIPNPVMRRKRSGRPKTSRIHNEMDEVESEQLKKCGWCRTVGHNRKTCPLRSRELGESSRQHS